MMSANNTLQHTGIPDTWSCFTIAGTNAAANSNLALGSDGPDAITGYIWDFGANNYAVGHRRWILYPQTQVMAAGDVPAEGSYDAANATWVFDANLLWPAPGHEPAFCLLAAGRFRALPARVSPMVIRAVECGFQRGNGQHDEQRRERGCYHSALSNQFR